MERPYLDPRPSASEDDIFQKFISGARISDYLTIDTETNGPVDEYDIRDGRGWGIGISLSYRLYSPTPSALYFPFRHEGVLNNLSQSYLSQLKDLIEKHPCVVFHNAKFDLVALRTMGINVTGKFYDTMLMAQWINENLPSKELDFLANKFLGERKGNDETFKRAIKLFGWAGCPVEIMAKYAAKDAELTCNLFYKLYPEFVAQEFDTEDLWGTEQAWVRLISAMECMGTRVDLDLAHKKAEQGRQEMENLRAALGYNPLSSKDLEFLLIGELNLPIVKRSTKTGKPSFDKYAMEEYELMLDVMNSPVAQQILAYRGWSKATSSYWDNYIRLVSPDGRIRPNYKLHGTVTGRLSCEKPNLQQIPRAGEKDWNRDTKQGFIPADGFGLWEADYSQLEFRLGAAFAAQFQPDLELIDIFADPSRDVFQEMADKLGFSRFNTKTLTYTIQYGGGGNRISTVFGVPLQQGVLIRDHWYNSYPGFKSVSGLAAQRCRSNGFIRLWTGRRRHFFDPQAEAHKAFNSAIQGGAAEIVKRTMLRLASELSDPRECRLLLQVHDSVVFEIEKGKEKRYQPEIERIMANVKPDFGVVFRADFHEWGK